MTTTREKLAVYLEQHDLAEVLESSVLGYKKHLDALEAIVQEARDSAIEECAVLVDGGSGSIHIPSDYAGRVVPVDTRPMAQAIRALKKAKP